MALPLLATVNCLTRDHRKVSRLIRSSFAFPPALGVTVTVSVSLTPAFFFTATFGATGTRSVGLISVPTTVRSSAPPVSFGVVST